MKILTSELIDLALDWAAAKCEGMTADMLYNFDENGWIYGGGRRCSTDWAQCGPIIEREWISVYQVGKSVWKADIAGLYNSGPSPTPLVAAMRCYVASKLGDEVDIPEELLP